MNYAELNLIYTNLKALWRKTQELGLVKAYMVDEEIRNFLMMFNAIPFLPVDKIGS